MGEVKEEPSEPALLLVLLQLPPPLILKTLPYLFKGKERRHVRKSKKRRGDNRKQRRQARQRMPPEHATGQVTSRLYVYPTAIL